MKIPVLRSRSTRIREALIEAGGQLTGSQIQKATRLWSGTLYPTLMRMEDRGELVSEWVPGKYPRRRLYRLRKMPKISPTEIFH